MTTVIVGAGHAGGSAAAFMRSYGSDEQIVLVGAEPHPPYQRPPLSKAFLKNEAGPEELLLRPRDFYAQNAIDMRLGRRVTAVDRDGSAVLLDDGERLAYDTLVLATGARPRAIAVPGADLAGVLTLRDIGDAEAIRAALVPGHHIAIVGGGYIGLELAASAITSGATATVVEREDRCLARVASEPLARFFEDHHRAQGVRFVLGTDLVAIEGEDHTVRAVRLRDGETIACNAVIVGVGAVPNDELARAAGLPCSNGVEVDEDGRTADACIYAIGDVSCRPIPGVGDNLRLESVPGALEQARRAAAHICGRAVPAAQVPWFWSDQYELKLQIAGLAVDCDRVVVRGDPATRRFAVFHLRGEQVRAVEAVNAAPEFLVGRGLVGSGQPVSLDWLAHGDLRAVSR